MVAAERSCGKITGAVVIVLAELGAICCLLLAAAWLTVKPQAARVLTKDSRVSALANQWI